ncbi:MAG TPA: UDP-glucose/GDP-mannose dehydrogenase family protein [Terriglobia bacterium]|nr:UDP-glucose/GDP-mannose dehydrogenase family protein [Terriglobia bacterium]
MSDNSNRQEMNLDDATITVLGLGHIGLPTALGLAELGRQVIGADDDKGKVGRIRAGDPIFFEPGLDDLLSKHLQTGRFQPVDDVEAAVRSGSIIFICVGTPQKASGQADLGQVEAVARVVARNLNGYKLIVEKSTVPAITAHWLKRAIVRYNPGKFPAVAGEGTVGMPSPAPLDFDIASNPEFLREGRALEDFFHPDRIVCGVDSARARDILTSLYNPLQRPIVVTDTSTAELIKHAANAFLSTKISFINMVSDLCEEVGANVTSVTRGIGLDSRIGPQFLDAGIGYGGYCFPKDLRAFIHVAEEHGVDFSLLQEVERVNQRRVDVFIKKVHKALWTLRGKTLGILGLAFKPGTDDIREAVSLKIIQALLDEGCILRLYDPQAMPNTQEVFPASTERLTYCSSAYEAAHGAQALLLLTEWEEFRQIDLSRVRDSMEVPILVDGRNLFDPEAVRKAGFEYISVGRDGATPVGAHTHSA